MGVSRVGQEGANAPSWNLKIMASYVVSLYGTLNFSLAPSAFAFIARKFSLKRRKIAKCFIFCPRRANKSTIFPILPAVDIRNFVLRTENLQTFSISSFFVQKTKKVSFWLKIVPLLGKFPGDAHVQMTTQSYFSKGSHAKLLTNLVLPYCFTPVTSDIRAVKFA